MSYPIIAQCIHAEINDEMRFVGFADTNDSPEHYVVIQQAIEPDEQDIRLNMDKIYLSTANQMRGGYGGLQSIEVSVQTICLRLNDKGKEALQLTGDIEISLADIKAAEQAILILQAMAANDQIPFLDNR